METTHVLMECIPVRARLSQISFSSNVALHPTEAPMLWLREEFPLSRPPFGVSVIAPLKLMPPKPESSPVAGLRGYTRNERAGSCGSTLSRNASRFGCRSGALALGDPRADGSFLWSARFLGWTWCGRGDALVPQLVSHMTTGRGDAVDARAAGRRGHH